MSNNVNHELYQCALDNYAICLRKPKYDTSPGKVRKPRRTAGDPLIDTEKDAYLDDNECWNWRWEPTNNGYAQIRVPKCGQISAVHRLLKLKADNMSSQDTVNESGETKVAHHCCNNRRCVNPEHIQWVMTGANTSLAEDKREQNRNRLADNKKEVLSMHQGGATQKEIAEKFEVNTSSVGPLLERWKK